MKKHVTTHGSPDERAALAEGHEIADIVAGSIERYNTVSYVIPMFACNWREHETHNCAVSLGAQIFAVMTVCF